MDALAQKRADSALAERIGVSTEHVFEVLPRTDEVEHRGAESVAVAAQYVGGGIASIVLSADGHPMETYTALCNFTFAQPVIHRNADAQSADSGAIRWQAHPDTGRNGRRRQSVDRCL